MGYMKIRAELTDESILTELGARIRALRIRLAIKQEELAARCGISRKLVMRLEAGDGTIRLENFLPVLRQLGVLNSLDVVLPENVISPLEMANMEHRGKALPKTVRSRKPRPKRTVRWGDEER